MAAVGASTVAAVGAWAVEVLGGDPPGYTPGDWVGALTIGNPCPLAPFSCIGMEKNTSLFPSLIRVT